MLTHRWLALCAPALFFVACGSDDPTPASEPDAADTSADAGDDVAEDTDDPDTTMTTDTGVEDDADVVEDTLDPDTRTPDVIEEDTQVEADTTPDPGVDYSDLAHWMCHPGLEEDACDVNLDYTRVFADGTTEVVTHVPAEDPAIDCFYVYPTASADMAGNSDLTPGVEEHFFVETQGAPFNQLCRVYSPIYRQVTLPALLGFVSDPYDPELSFGDISAAWAHYWEHENDGRGVILIAHSQGTLATKTLIAQELESDPAFREQLIAAYLFGGSIELPEGADVGGTFDAIPACRAPEQTGCVVSAATFRTDGPPEEGSWFGGAEEGHIALCHHPAALDGSRGALDARLPTTIPGLIGYGVGTTATPWADPDAHEPLTTDYFSLPGLLEGECAYNGYSYLAVDILADPEDPRADDISGDISMMMEWGLHMLDVNIVMNDLLALAERQTEAWLARE